uniref:DUF4283 domain-containing protein n=1 Tax=Tanacetum cinerariifolium TaxID=118510 RepID=A0A6L2JVT0_TANCI|nr:hypothetical protein [Tanacetum cinerariifolium]
MASKKVNSSGSSLWNVESSSTNTTPIAEKIDTIKRLIINGKATLVDDEGKPLAKVDSSGDHDSENEVASVDNKNGKFLASKKVGYGTNSLLEQWKKKNENDDYDFDPKNPPDSLWRLMVFCLKIIFDYVAATTQAVLIPFCLWFSIDRWFWSMWCCLELHGLNMNRGFLDSGGRNTNHRKKMNTDLGTGSFTESYRILNDASPLDASAVKKVVSPPVILESVAKEKQSSVVAASMPNVEKTSLGSYPPLPMQGTNPAGNTPGNSSYANFIGEPSREALNFHTLFTPRGYGVDVVVPVDSIRASSERFVNTAYGFFLGKRVAYPVVANYVKLHGVPVKAFSEDGLSAIATKLDTPLMLDSYTSDMFLQSWGRSSYARAMIELRVDVELKDTIVVAMPKITGEGYYTKIEKLIIDGKTTLVDDVGKPLKKVEYPDDHDSEDEIESVDNYMARSMALERVGFDTKSLLEQ